MLSHLIDFDISECHGILRCSRLRPEIDRGGIQ